MSSRSCSQKDAAFIRPKVACRPPRLQPGDTIGIVAPASAPCDPRNVDRGVAALEELGFKVRLAPNVLKRLGFLAGSDRERAGDLMRMFTDHRISAVVCVRGGHGASRLLGLLDYGTIRAHPKIFVGYSDITALHCALLTQANLISFHGPMLNSDFAKSTICDFTVKSFLAVLMPPQEKLRSLRRVNDSDYSEPQSPLGISKGYHKKTVQTLRLGLACGQLIGGNLTLLCATVGTPCQPSFQNRILFFEDFNEKPYRFDRMLTYLLNCGLLQQVAGVAIGVNQGCQDRKAKTACEYRQTLEDVFKERLLPLGVPVVMGLPFGHVRHNATLPVGGVAVLDANRGELFLTDLGVR